MNILVIDAQGGVHWQAACGGDQTTYCKCGGHSGWRQQYRHCGHAESRADYGATGENAVVVGCRKADVIVGPIGIVIPDALFGELRRGWQRPWGKARRKES